VTAAEAARSGEIVIVAIPERAIMDLPKDLFEGVPSDVVVIGTGNYYPARDHRIAAIDDGQIDSECVAEQPGRPVVKAFNNIHAQHLMDLGRPVGTPHRIALPVAGDDEAAKAVVLQLVDEMGFDGVDAGGLDESWRQQPGTPVYGKDFDADGVRRGLLQASRERSPEWRAKAGSPGRLAKPA